MAFVPLPTGGINIERTSEVKLNMVLFALSGVKYAF